jgi:hypothetical protein
MDLKRRGCSLMAACYVFQFSKMLFGFEFS